MVLQRSFVLKTTCRWFREKVWAIVSPLGGFILSYCVPTAPAVGYVLPPLRGFIPFLPCRSPRNRRLRDQPKQRLRVAVEYSLCLGCRQTGAGALHVICAALEKIADFVRVVTAE
jgi:hypothetical protein